MEKLLPDKSTKKGGGNGCIGFLRHQQKCIK